MGPTAKDLTISTAQARTGSQSGYIAPGDDGPQDVLLLLGNKTSGQWPLEFYMYIPVGRTGYFNIQGETVNGGAGNSGLGFFNSSNIFFNELGNNGGSGQDQTQFDSFTYPEASWFKVDIMFDMDSSPPTYTITVDGNQGSTTNFEDDTVLGAIDFFSEGTNSEFYIDDVNFGNVITSQEVLLVDLSTPNQVTISATTPGLSSATISGLDLFGFYLENFYNT